MATVTKTITAQNTFTDPLRVAGKKVLGLSVTSTALSATITLQRRRTDSDAWGDVASFTTNVEKIVESWGSWQYRAGVKTGGFTSATALVVTLSF
jgi:hypothetical protein